MILYLVRHGETDWNVGQKAQGHTDIPLNPNGTLQAQRLAEAMAALKIDLAYSSDLQRCIQTATPIAKVLGINLNQEKLLRERSFGSWEGQSYGFIRAKTEARQQEEGLNRYEVRPPKGESYADLWQRLMPFTDAITQLNKTVLLVTHGGTASVILSQLLHGELRTTHSFRFGNASITKVETRPDGTRFLAVYADESHLS